MNSVDSGSHVSLEDHCVQILIVGASTNPG
jgi:hypothetical protein